MSQTRSDIRAALTRPARLRVAIVTSFPADSDQPRGGVEAVCVNLVPALARFDDLEVHVVTTDRDCPAATVASWRAQPSTACPGEPSESSPTLPTQAAATCETTCSASAPTWSTRTTSTGS